jgi:GNAT superfamily N-acetyltransferase
LGTDLQHALRHRPSLHSCVLTHACDLTSDATRGEACTGPPGCASRRAVAASDRLGRMDSLSRFRDADTEYVIRRASAEDISAIVELIAADQIGKDRDGGDLLPYMRAFEAIDADPAQLLVVVAEEAGAVVATLQLSFIPGLARRGALRAQIEAVRVAEQLRGRGIGAALLSWAVQEASRRGCALVQLTSDKRREDAHRLYGRLGFTASHDGFKLGLAVTSTGH